MRDDAADTAAPRRPDAPREGAEFLSGDEADAKVTRLVSRRNALVGGLVLGALPVIGVSVAVARRRRADGRLVSDLRSADPFYVAHRGGSRDWPEMSMAAYRAAVGLGVDALEISLARTSDGVVRPARRDAGPDIGHPRLRRRRHTWGRCRR